MTTIYGIKNCDTMKKAFNWLDDQDVNFTFHDYKKDGVPEDILKDAIAAHGWENVINRRGTTWRQLPEHVKETMDEANAVKAAIENSSLIKRPLLHHNDNLHLGFKENDYLEIFG